MALATKHRSPDLWLKWNLIVLTAIVADDLETLRCIVTLTGLLRPAFCAPLRRHHVALVKDLLLLFGEKEGLFTLNARGLYVRHMVVSLYLRIKKGDGRILT